MADGIVEGQMLLTTQRAGRESISLTKYEDPKQCINEPCAVRKAESTDLEAPGLTDK